MLTAAARRRVAALRQPGPAARLARALWIAWAIVVWNVVFDRVIVVAGRSYVAAAVPRRRRRSLGPPAQHGRLDAAGRHARLLDGHGGRRRHSRDRLRRGAPSALAEPGIGPWHSECVHESPLQTETHSEGDPVRIAPHPLIYDWNHDAVADGPSQAGRDARRRDAARRAAVAVGPDPTIDEKIEILHHMDALGIDTADIGLPGAGPKVARDVERLARAIGDGR